MEQDQKAPAIGVSLQVVLDQNRTLVLQSHVDRRKDVLDATLDMLTASADRQDAKYSLVRLRAAQEVSLKNLDDIQSEFGATFAAAKANWEESGRNGEFKAEGATAAELGKKDALIANLRREIEGRGAEIKRLEDLAG